MTWTRLESEKRVKAEQTSKAEIDQLRDLVKRNLGDAFEPWIAKHHPALAIQTSFDKI